MSDSNKAYQAKIVREAVNGKTLPSIEDIIRDKLQNNKNLIYKREELVDLVAITIELPKDDTISGAVSSALAKLEEAGSVEKVTDKHGYWQGK